MPLNPECSEALPAVHSAEAWSLTLRYHVQSQDGNAQKAPHVFSSTFDASANAVLAMAQGPWTTMDYGWNGWEHVCIWKCIWLQAGFQQRYTHGISHSILAEKPDESQHHATQQHRCHGISIVGGIRTNLMEVTWFLGGVL